MIIVIEGNDQAGKKTQAELLNKELHKRGIETRMFSFPDYTTDVGKLLKKYLKEDKYGSEHMIHYLMAANRHERRNDLVWGVNGVSIVNRYTPSNLVYGAVNAFDPDWIKSLDKGIPEPDLVIVLDIDGDTSFGRKKHNRDMFEKDHEKCKYISSTYRYMAVDYGWKIVDGEGTKEEVHKRVMKIIDKCQLD